MGPILGTLLSILVTIVLYILYHAISVNRHWKKRGLPHVKPTLFFGNNLDMMVAKLYVSQLLEKLCQRFPDEPLIGYYNFLKPTIIVKDLDYIERILVKDFSHFTDHGFPLDEKRNPLDSNLFGMIGKRWKALRIKLSPMFTTGKLKAMYESMTPFGQEIIHQVDKGIGEDFIMSDVINCFTIDSTGSCAFGIESDSLSKPESKFRQVAAKALKVNFLEGIKLIILTNIPILRYLLNITFSKKEVVSYFAEIIKDTLQFRREHNYKRNDFLQLMMQLQDKGYVEIQSKDAADDYLNIDPLNATSSTEKFELSDEQLTGHAVTFLLAGFEPVTTTTQYTLYEFTKNLDLQEKVRNEILEMVEQEGSLSYDAIKKMTYLEQCIKETLRRYSPAPMLLRVCTKEYQFPNGYTVDAGQDFVIPVTAVHHDPRYYPNPDQYDPERFNPGNNIPACAFLPFGNGPRICIGMRFAFLEMKFFLAKLLMNYRFHLSPKTKEPLEISLKHLITTSRYPIYFNITRLNS